nr:hypothetical protein [Vibrio splendidus]MCC4880856.1 hypothetical protein [Vibrio splendidus]
MNIISGNPQKVTFINSYNDEEYEKWTGQQGTIERLIVNPTDEIHTNIVDPINMPIIELKMQCGTVVQACASDIAEDEHPEEIKAFILGLHSFNSISNKSLASEDEVSLIQIAESYMPKNLCEQAQAHFAYGFAVGSHKA